MFTMINPTTTREERLKARNAAIRADAKEIYNKGYRMDHIVIELEKKYALSRITIEDILFKRGKYARM